MPSTTAMDMPVLPGPSMNVSSAKPNSEASKTSNIVKSRSQSPRSSGKKRPPSEADSNEPGADMSEIPAKVKRMEEVCEVLDVFN